MKNYNDLSKVPHYEIITDMTFLDQKIGVTEIKIQKLKKELNDLCSQQKTDLNNYEKLRLEIIKRFPPLENEESFKKKVLK